MNQAHKEHDNIEYDKINYICNLHNESFSSFCKKCNNNLCMFCESEHKDKENIIYYRDILPKKDMMKSQIEEIKNSINIFKKKIQEIKNILDSISINLEIYYNINDNVLKQFEKKNRNFQLFKNMNEMINNNINILKELNTIKNENDKIQFFTYAFKIYEQMNNKNINNKQNKIDISIQKENSNFNYKIINESKGKKINGPKSMEKNKFIQKSENKIKITKKGKKLNESELMNRSYTFITLKNPEINETKLMKTSKSVQNIKKPEIDIIKNESIGEKRNGLKLIKTSKSIQNAVNIRRPESNSIEKIKSKLVKKSTLMNNRKIKTSEKTNIKIESKTKIATTSKLIKMNNSVKSTAIKNKQEIKKKEKSQPKLMEKSKLIKNINSTKKLEINNIKIESTLEIKKEMLNMQGISKDIFQKEKKTELYQQTNKCIKENRFNNTLEIFFDKINKNDKNLYFAKVAEEAGRYDDMFNFLENECKKRTSDFNSEERNFINCAYKNLILNDRSSLRTICYNEARERKRGTQDYLSYAIEYKNKVFKELQKKCKNVLNIIDEYLLKKGKDDEAIVFYYKMKGDYNAYIAQFAEGNIKILAQDSALKAYTEAIKRSSKLWVLNPVYLELILNYSYFLYEILNDKKKAIDIVGSVINKADKELPNIDEDADENRDTVSNYNLLNENLEMWENEEYEE